MLTGIEFSALTDLVFNATNGELPADLDEVKMMVIFGKLSRVMYRLEPPYDAVSIVPTSSRNKKRPLEEHLEDVPF
jgi:hypothetical protein